MNEQKPYDPRYLHLIFSALLMIQLVLTCVVLYVGSESANILLLPFEGNTYAIPGIAFVLVLLGRYVWNNGMKEINGSDNLLEKLELLTKIHIWRWVLVQLGTLILLTYTLVDSNFYYFIFALVNIVYFFTLRPKIFGLIGET
jgi:glucose-6-phosphate-specific signal transduction histidine kinase